MSNIKLTLITQHCLFTKDKRLVFTSKDSIWKVKPFLSSAKSNDEKIINQLENNNFKTYKELRKKLKEYYKEFNVDEPTYKVVRTNLYFVKELKDFIIYTVDNKWVIVYRGTESFTKKIYLEDLPNVNFEKRKEALKYLKQWAFYHNLLD